MRILTLTVVAMALFLGVVGPASARTRHQPTPTPTPTATPTTAPTVTPTATPTRGTFHLPPRSSGPTSSAAAR